MKQDGGDARYAVVWVVLLAVSGGANFALAGLLWLVFLAILAV